MGQEGRIVNSYSEERDPWWFSGEEGFWGFLFVCFGFTLICFWLHWAFVALHGLSQLQRVGANLRCSTRVFIVVASLVAGHRL